MFLVSPRKCLLSVNIRSQQISREDKGTVFPKITVLRGSSESETAGPTLTPAHIPEIKKRKVEWMKVFVQYIDGVGQRGLLQKTFTASKSDMCVEYALL